MAKGDGDDPLKSTHIAIVVGIALGVTVLILCSLIFTVVLNRRDRKFAMSFRNNPNERLKCLDKVSPIRTLEEWWTATKGKLGLSEAVDNQFVCAVCLEQVERSEKIRELQCLHVFHQECLEKWFLGDHFNCPLCHRAYYVPNHPPRSEYVYMV